MFQLRIGEFRKRQEERQEILNMNYKNLAICVEHGIVSFSQDFEMFPIFVFMFFIK